MKKYNILFAGHDLKFAQPLIKFFQESSNFLVKIDKWEGHNIHNEQQSFDCLEWADIIICEWGLGNAVWYSNHKKKSSKINSENAFTREGYSLSKTIQHE